MSWTWLHANEHRVINTTESVVDILTHTPHSIACLWTPRSSHSCTGGGWCDPFCSCPGSHNSPHILAHSPLQKTGIFGVKCRVVKFRTYVCEHCLYIVDIRHTLVAQQMKVYAQVCKYKLVKDIHFFFSISTFNFYSGNSSYVYQRLFAVEDRNALSTPLISPVLLYRSFSFAMKMQVAPFSYIFFTKC